MGERVYRGLLAVLSLAARGMPRAEYSLGILRGMDGILPRECPCCGYRGRFSATGTPPRFDAQCPRCDALERHRLFVLGSRALDLFTCPIDVLHFAPEAAVRAYVQPRAARYVTADLAGVGVDRKESIEAMSFPDASFDMIIALHVLEHVDDHRAIRELKRVLRPSGRLVCMVPIIEGWDTTHEDATIVTPEARELHFGQSDHVRYYGRDFRDRLQAAGFSLTEYTAEGGLSPRYGLLRGEKVLVASAIVGSME